MLPKRLESQWSNEESYSEYSDSSVEISDSPKIWDSTFDGYTREKVTFSKG